MTLSPGASDFQQGKSKTSRPTAERAFIIVPDLSGHGMQAPKNRHIAGDGFDAPSHPATSSRSSEAEGLALAIGLEIADTRIVPLKTIKPATLFGSGKVTELCLEIAESEAGLAIIDHPLTPVQQRNLEKLWQVKVLDRTGLILEIFGARARTREGTLQVELAHLNYQKSRLVRSWTHLERQRGGLGFVGGPGETQIEADRRLIQKRINRLERELEKVRKTRALHRANRRKVPHPVVALVGYTNAGKSTLFNRMTGADVVVRNQLFATLDPTLRKLDLPNATPAILSDTVGFISNLPTTLVAAFHATLEEVIEADLILHVRDIADRQTGTHRDQVNTVLGQLGVDGFDDQRILEVWNKSDLLDNNPMRQGEGTNGALGAANNVLVSALTGAGIDRLLVEIEARLGGSDRVVMVKIGPDQMKAVNWFYANAKVIETDACEDGTVIYRLRIAEHLAGELKRRAEGAVVEFAA